MITSSAFKTGLAGFLFGAFSMTGIAQAASYNYVDPGDVYYVNDWGSENRRVVVVRKIGSGQIKVRNVHSGATFVVHAERLLTRSQLQAEEVGNAVVGTAIVFCVITQSCK